MYRWERQADNERGRDDQKQSSKRLTPVLRY